MVHIPQSTVPRPQSWESGRWTGSSGQGTGDLDSAVVAVPSDSARQQAVRLVRGGGQVLLFAHTKRAGQIEKSSAFGLDLASICLDEKDLIGSYSSDFTLQDEIARLVFSRRFDVRQLIAHRFPLEEASAAVALAANPKPDSLKILVSVSLVKQCCK